MRARLVTALLCVSLAATGCSDDEPSAGPTLPPITEAPTVSASPTAEPVPSEATAATPQGAQQFAGHFAEQVNAAYLTLDAGRIERLSDPACQTCLRYRETIDEIKGRNATVNQDYSVEVLDAAAPGEAAGAQQTSVTLVLRIGELVVTDDSGAELLRETASDRVVQDIDLKRQSNGWLVTEVTSD